MGLVALTAGHNLMSRVFQRLGQKPAHGFIVFRKENSCHLPSPIIVRFARFPRFRGNPAARESVKEH